MQRLRARSHLCADANGRNRGGKAGKCGRRSEPREVVGPSKKIRAHGSDGKTSLRLYVFVSVTWHRLLGSGAKTRVSYFILLETYQGVYWVALTEWRMLLVSGMGLGGHP